MSAYDTVTAGLALMGFIILGWVVSFGTSGFHSNPAQMELELKATADQALQAAGHDWAYVEFNGQYATVFGAPVSEAAKAEAAEIVLTSAGKGGLLYGGVIAVNTKFDPVVAIPEITPYIWRAIKAPSGEITLIGHVPSEDVRTVLIQEASGLVDQEIVDRLELGRGRLPENWSDQAGFALKQIDLIDSGEASLTDTDLHVAGIALEDSARIRVIAEVANLTDPWSGTTRLKGPSHWTAVHLNNQLILSGQVESAELKQEIAAVARSAYSGTVVDQTEVAASSYDDWTDGVKAGLPHFSKFKSGEMAFDPKGLGYVFEGEATASTLAYLNEDMATVDTSYATDIVVETVAVDIEELSGVDLGADPVIACQTAFDLVMASNKVYFDTGNAVITRQSGLTLDKILAVSQSCPETLNIELGGHTDSSGDAEANLVLSEARAEAVANYLGDAGFDRTRLIVRGYGSQMPASDNSTPEGRAANRRIEFKVQERSD